MKVTKDDNNGLRQTTDGTSTATMWNSSSGSRSSKSDGHDVVSNKGYDINDAHAIKNLLRNKRLIFIGDSITR